MKISPYPTGRFKNYLEQKSAAFRDLIYQCQVNTRYFDAGEAILRQGEQLQYLHIVPVGRVSMSILAANGRRFQLGEANCDYHIYGEMEYFTQTPCQWNVVADEHMQVDVICIQKLTEALQQHPEMMVFFASALAEDYQDSMDIYTNRLLHPITYNIAYDLLVRNQTDTLLGGFDKVNQEAERFGTSGRVYRRAVKDLIDKGLIAKTSNGLVILDEMALKAFIDSHE
ncbi:TPA: Crp/Fnr family transcriptional regulator [Vibrio parahaemolyticus]|uniref:Crp/Fnr family transcriptional regulator n=1 Tax=Vibrio parahaemolyticus TaxID=670 RepID=UPI001E414FFC|nr:Crp/Fnr family transcriptional regulator [Vibrio parahaemolyticus]MBE4294057.1 Crp/Fnr family transcriptional regulator [Vibrio parahaemolyticus]HCE2386769.1 Crp/Fnr family transcriptional regulator [Vibrio parahaemolyticus]HCE2668488.1 Crp/Fnr family transcriptional regulator [Vibrio parahaemolyticus]HCE4612913.1 Crp/Fnr family transcriptional regulator [Vibrio parahaemolyticus]HCG8762236.1 Crp/Fnr family transcriptional regulator [Vibrio parahaemolyticus]